MRPFLFIGFLCTFHPGSTAVVLFDRPVNVCRLRQCSDILSADTLAAMGQDNTRCQWATKHLLTIQLGKPAYGTWAPFYKA